MILAGCVVRMVLSAVQYCRRAQWKPISDDTYGWAAWRSIHFGGVPAPTTSRRGWRPSTS